MMICWEKQELFIVLKSTGLNVLEVCLG